MSRAPRFSRAHAIALTRPVSAEASWREWVLVALALALLLGGLVN